MSAVGAGGPGQDAARGPGLAPGAKVIGLDVGDARIGLAVGSVGSPLAFGRGALTRQGTRKDVAALMELLAAEGASAFVVGLPLRLGGGESEQTARVRSFAAALTGAGARVEFEDERLTTRAARRQLSGAGLPRASLREKARLDEAAAVLILQSWLMRAEAGA